MTTSTDTITALDILKQTRDLFAKTHWTEGTLYTVDKTGKKQFCMVGGLCHIFVESEAPDWVKQNSDNPAFYPGAAQVEKDEVGIPNDYLPNIDFTPILDAELELAKTIDPDLSRGSSSSQIEDTIIGWNDSDAYGEYKIRGDASYVIEVMDETIARVEAEQK